MTRPLIGITSKFYYENNEAALYEGYYRGIERAGGIPVVLPVPCELSTTKVFLEKLDGLLLSGGPDVDAKHFSEDILNCSSRIDPYRDDTELLSAKLAMEIDLPLLGICRGMQVMNIVSGGSLHQDINVSTGSEMKHVQDAPKWYPTHQVKITSSSKLYDIFSTESLFVNSFHHQALKAIGNNFVVSAKSSDEIIEAIEDTTKKFCLGVQWHPELMWEKHPIMLKLFEAFVNACKKH